MYGVVGEVSMYRCEEKNAEAPQVGCGCRDCYRARERSLDPRLIELVNERMRPMMVVVKPSTEILHRAIQGYCAGRIDYGALHLNIIKSLMEALDREFESTLAMKRVQQFPIKV